MQRLDVVVLGTVEGPVTTTFGDVRQGSEFVVAPLEELLSGTRIVPETQERGAVHVGIEVDRATDGLPLLGLLELAVQDERLGDGDIGFELEAWWGRGVGVGHRFDPLARVLLAHLPRDPVHPVKPSLGQ